MNEAKHTKGPWEAFDNAGSNMQSYSQSSGVITTDDKKIICGCFMDIGGKGVAAANARLIAAAPDLLEALLEARKFIPLASSWARNQADAAIRKAEGIGQ